MKWDRLNQAMQMLSNVGVVAGLVLVAVQMNHNTEAIRLQNYAGLVNGYATLEMANIGDSGSAAYAAAVFRPSEMTEEQFTQVLLYLDVVLSQTFNTWSAYQSGYASEADWAQAKSWAALNFSFDFAQELWKHWEFGLPPDVRDQINAEMTRQDRGGIQNAYRSTFTRIQKLGATSDAHPARTPASSVPVAPAAS